MSPQSEFDFDFWCELAASDPQAFEAQRRVCIEALIAQVAQAHQARLRGMQWRIDIERKKFHHPLASSTHLFNKMWTAVYGEGGLADALNGVLPKSKESASVLKFMPDRRQRLRGVGAR